MRVPAALAHDGLVNVVSGLGTNVSKRSHNFWQLDCLSNWQQLDAAYQSNWIARGVCDIPAEDATREWRRIKAERAEDIAQVESDLNLASVVEEAQAWANLYGGAGVVMITNQDLEQPLNIDAIGRGNLENLMVFDRHDLVPMSLNYTDILANNYLQPDYYTVLGGSQRIHWTHVARFMGARLPRRQQVMTQGWGDSLLRNCLEEIADMVAAKGGIAELMQEANVDVITREDLDQELASDQEDEIITRFDAVSQMKSIINMILLSGGETYQRNTLSLSGVAQILEQFITWISGCTGIPVTRLFGTSAKGMNATGEGDMKNYNDKIRKVQTSRIAPPLSIIDQVLVRSAVGSFPSDFDYVWNPLEQMNEVEEAQAALLRAQTHQMYLDSNIVQRSQVMRELQAGEEYQFDDDELLELEEMEEGNLFESLPDLTQMGLEAPQPPALPPQSDQEFIDRYMSMADQGINHEAIIHQLGAA